MLAFFLLPSIYPLPLSWLQRILMITLCNGRESAATEKIKEAHRKVMIANHPDAGGSHYLASKINEAKDVMLKKPKDSGSAF